MKTNISFLILLSCFVMINFLMSCGISEMAGSYSTSYPMYNLKLNEDSTYQFKYQVGFKQSISYGDWRMLDNKRIVLSSLYDDLFNIPIDIEVNNDSEIDSVLFMITTKFIEDDKCYYSLLLNDSIQIDSRRIMIMMPKINELNTIRLCYSCNDDSITPYPLVKEVCSKSFNVQNFNANVFELKWNIGDEIFYYETFKQDTVEVNGNRLLFNRLSVALNKVKN